MDGNGANVMLFGGAQNQGLCFTRIHVCSVIFVVLEIFYAVILLCLTLDMFQQMWLVHVIMKIYTAGRPLYQKD